MEHEEHEKRLQAQAEADAKAQAERHKRRKIRKTPQIDSSITNIPVVDQVDAVDLPAAISVASESVHELPVDASPKQPAKRLKVVGSPSVRCLPEQTPMLASSSSVTLGHTLSSLIPISGDNPDILQMDFVACGTHSAAHATQALLWIIEQSNKSLEESKYRDKLKKDVDYRVAEDQKKVADAASKIKKLKKQLKDAIKEKDELKKSLADKEMERAAAVEAQLTAETVWYGKGNMARLAMVRDAGLPYMDCLSEWERQMGDPFAAVNEAPIEEESEAPSDADDKNGSDGTGEN